jgi:hypothetical protein
MSDRPNIGKVSNDPSHKGPISTESLLKTGKTEAAQGAQVNQAAHLPNTLTMAEGPVKEILKKVDVGIFKEVPSLTPPAALQMKTVGKKDSAQGPSADANAGTGGSSLSTEDLVNSLNVHTGLNAVLEMKLTGDIMRSARDTQLNTIKANTNQEIQYNKDQADAMTSSNDALNKSKHWQLAQKIIGWAGAAIGAVMVVATVASGGLLAAVPVILAAAIGIGLMIGSKHGSPVTNALSKGFSKVAEGGLDLISDIGHALSGGKWEMDPDKKDKVAHVLGQITTAVLIIVVQVALMAASGKLQPKGKAMSMFEELAKKTQFASMVMGGCVKLGGGVTEIGGSVTDKRSEDFQADAKQFEAFSHSLQSCIQQINQLISKFIDAQQELNQNAMSILTSLADTISSSSQAIRGSAV